MKIFKNKNFSRFLFGESLALFGYYTLQMAISLYLLDITQSATKFASAFILNTVPALLFGLFAGVIVDKLDRKKLLVFLDLIRSFVLFSTFFIDLNENVIYVLLLFFGTCSVFFAPAFVTILPSILEKKDLVEGNAIKNTFLEGGKITAPILGALIYGMFGIQSVMLLAALFFLFSANVLRNLEIESTSTAGKLSSVIYELKEGFAVYKDVRLTSLVINGFLTHVFLTAIFFLGFPYMLKNMFNGTDLDIALVESVATLGLVLSIFAVEAVKNKISIGNGIFIGIIGMIVTVMPLALLVSNRFVSFLNGTYLSYLIFFGVVTFGMFLVRGLYGSFFVAYYQQNVEANKLGRFFSVMSIVFALGQIIGYQLFGYLLDNQPLVVVIIVLSIGVVLKVVVHIPFMMIDKKLKLKAEEAVKVEV